MAQVQWFPGHMARTKRLILDNLKRVDVIIEVLDARAPLSSRNPLLRDLTASKPRLAVLNKDDLADPHATALWAERFREEGRTLPVRVSASSRKGIDSIQKSCRELCLGANWLSRRPVRALIAGIPNVGKSTLINSLSGRRRAAAGATPGLTRDLRRIAVNSRFELFDTPGLLWHKFEDPLTGLILASLGAIKETILPDEEVTGEFLYYMSEVYPSLLQKRYRLEDIPDNPHSLVEAVGRKRGCLLAGARVDLPRTCQIVLKDLREGKFGQISLEWPDKRGWN
jgi:ribosome biogenesis GTPase A